MAGDGVVVRRIAGVPTVPSQRRGERLIDRDVACAGCRETLNPIDEGNKITYAHSVTVHRSHHPDPVPAHELDEVRRSCHFCSGPQPMWVYRTPFIEVEAAGNSVIRHEYARRWNACHACAVLIDGDDHEALTRRCATRLRWDMAGVKATLLGLIFRTITRTREPGKELLTTTRWTPAQMRADTLPKVRDRLMSVLRGPLRFAGPIINDEQLRAVLADGLEQARMCWIDPEFTALVREVLSDLPDTEITDRIVPSDSGMLVWSSPVDHRYGLAAASWTRHRDGWTVVCYRSVGADLPDAVMPDVREQIGWLLPVDVVHAPSGAVVNGNDLLAGLVSSWLLIAQKLTEEVPAAIEPSIRKAYHRKRRTQPEVRLVRIRQRPPAEKIPQQAHGSTPRAKATPDYRYWVSGHPRQQPCGPDRSLRKEIKIDPFLKGPKGKPIKASTVVRVLGSTRNDPRSQ